MIGFVWKKLLPHVSSVIEIEGKLCLDYKLTFATNVQNHSVTPAEMRKMFQISSIALHAKKTTVSTAHQKHAIAMKKLA